MNAICQEVIGRWPGPAPTLACGLWARSWNAAAGVSRHARWPGCCWTACRTVDRPHRAAAADPGTDGGDAGPARCGLGTGAGAPGARPLPAGRGRPGRVPAGGNVTDRSATRPPVVAWRTGGSSTLCACASYAAEHPETYDRRMWSVDRLHPSERGHRPIAGAYHQLLAAAGCPRRPAPGAGAPP